MRYQPARCRRRKLVPPQQHPKQGAGGVYRLELGPALWDAEVAALLRELGMG